MSSKQYDVLVIGAGASGLMTAYMAAQRGRKVVVVEKANKVGKKILMSGGGKCHFTNLEVEPKQLHFTQSTFCDFSFNALYQLGLYRLWYVNMALPMKSANMDSCLP